MSRPKLLAIRDALAETIFRSDYRYRHLQTGWDRQSPQAREPYYRNADAVLASGLLGPASPTDDEERRHEIAIAELREAIDFCHAEQRQVREQGRADEQLTLFQHWSATAGWLASRIRAHQRGDEPNWPDAMNTAALTEDGAA